MRCLITGGGGFIGSAIARATLDREDDVRILDNFSTGLKDNVPVGAVVIPGDLRAIDVLRSAVRDIDVVFHQGALSGVPRSIDDPLLTHACNANGTLNLLVAAHEAGVRRVVYASSSSVYGDGHQAVNHEDQAPNPLTPYAASKLAGEHYCRIWTRLHGLSTVALRYFNVFGPRQRADSKYSAVFPAFITALIEGRPPHVYWDGEQGRDFTYVGDVVRANLLAADAGPEVDGATINVGAGRPVSVNHVLRSVSEAVGRWIEPVRHPRRPGDVRCTQADIARARGLLGWAPTCSWEEAVDETVRWFVDRKVAQAV